MDLKKNLTDKLRDTTRLVQAKADDVTKYSEAKLKSALGSALSELQLLEEVLEEHGFVVTDLAVQVGVPPQLIMTVERVKSHPQTLIELANVTSLTRVQKAVINALVRVYALSDVVEGHEHVIEEVEIEVGLFPSIRAHLKQREDHSP